ncbi:hypothetical protein Patl1_22914 [Pistacia atlantica]|uniref:Uncharacterized protein n=1 Tax=Pistacia atlantica TaxID=434234 RepID=A0ACC0ZWI1_9ROSI|nr:hypothetical protein Patl1_22914 [Pistacia atlantica]
MEGLQFFKIAVVLQSLVIFSRHSFGFAATKSRGLSIKVIPIDSRESPLYNPNLTHRQKIERMVNVTLAKLSHQNSTFHDDKHFSAIDRQDLFYIALMLIGNPSQSVYVIVDTGSPLLWTQCRPCRQCFLQNYPIYNRQASSTYRGITCDDPLCNYNEEGSLFKCVGDRCVYRLSYGSGPQASGPTRGYASLESFHFVVNDDGDTETITLLFGCSTNNVNFDFGNDQYNMISGMLGLDLHPNSLASQLSDVFSYCIVPYDDNYPFDVHPHKLRFGADVFIPPHSIPTTQYVRVEGRDFYYLRLLDISVGDFRLNLPAGTFEPSSASGFFIDSASPASTLTTNSPNELNIFGMVNTAFIQYYESHNLERNPNPGVPFEVCYMNRQDFVDYPSLTFHFQGADYRVDGRFVNVQFHEAGFFCVAIMDHPSKSILGVYHMQNMRIIHNGQIGAIQFFPEDCAQDHF